MSRIKNLICSTTIIYMAFLLYFIFGIQNPCSAVNNNSNELKSKVIKLEKISQFENFAQKYLPDEIWGPPEKVVVKKDGYEVRLSNDTNAKLPFSISEDHISINNKKRDINFSLISSSNLINYLYNDRIYYLNPQSNEIYCYYRNKSDNQLREFIYFDEKPKNQDHIRYSWKFNGAKLKYGIDGEIVVYSEIEKFQLGSFYKDSKERESIKQKHKENDQVFQTNDILYKIPKPFYVDKKGKLHKDTIDYIIEDSTTLSLVINSCSDLDFPLLIDPTINASDADIKIYQSSTHDNSYANSLSSAGDFNGDGYEDLIIGHFGWENHRDEKVGKAYIYFVRLYGENDGDLFGYSVSGIGDFNNDGYDDVLVAAVGIESCFLFYGRNTTGNIYSYNADIKINSENLNINLGLGYSVSGIGDYNGDGFDDVILSDWSDGVAESRVYVIFGYNAPSRTTINAADSNIKIIQGSTHGGFHSVSDAGDFNADGLSDFIVGAPFTSDGAPFGGTAYVFYGKSLVNDVTYTVSDADVKIIGQTDGINIGEQVSSAGDYNGDGIKDILIGTEDSGLGTAFIFYGAGFESGSVLESSSADVKFKGGGTSSNYFGNKLSGAGDFNGDGYDDVIIGAPNDDGYGTDSGSAYLFYGRPALSGTIVSASEADQRYNGRGPEQYLGWSLAGIRNFNGDQFSDLVIGTPWDYHGYAFMFYGHHEPILTTYPAPAIPPTSEVKRDQIYHGTNPCQSVQGSPGPVFVQSGDFYHEHTDILIRSRGIPFEITRYYNTQDLYDGPFGHGWNMDYTTLLVQTEEEGITYATVRRGSGLRLKFMDNGDGTYTPPLGSHETLVKNPDDTFTLNRTCASCVRKPLPIYNFNTDGTLDSIQDMNGNTVSIGYYPNGRIESVTDANGRSLNFSYGSNARVETITDFSTPERQWMYGYDEDDNLTTVTDPANNIIQYQYDDHHNLTAIVDARGNTVSSMTYDGKDKVTGFTDKGGTYGIEYDPVSNLTTKTDPEGQLFSFNYDSNGNITNKLNPKNNTLNLTWDANINVTGKQNARGIETAYTYDDRGNILTITRDSADGGLNLTTTYEYDTRFDKVTKIIPPLGVTHQTTFFYDANGNLETKTTPAGTTGYDYDTHGNLTQVTDPDGFVTAMEYDANGYLERVYIPGTNPIIETTYTYDERGNILTKTDQNGNVTTYHYDVLDRLEWVEDATPEHNRTSFEYDANGNLILIRDPHLNETKFEYDTHNQLVKRIDGNVSPTLKRETEYGYDSRGNLTSVTDPLDQVTTYEYDELNQLVKVIDHLNNEWVFTYDESGNLLKKTDPNLNTTTNTYDSVNRLKTVTDAEGNATPDPDDYKTTYNYDLHGNLLTIVDANGHTAVTNTYDVNNRLETTKDPVQPTAALFTYYPSGRIHTKTDANGQISTYVYQALTGRLEKIQYAGGREETFTYDLAGNILSISDNQTGVTVSYTYDQLNRIISETQIGQTIAYTYDDVGNRRTMDVPGVGIFYYYHDELNRLDYMVNHLGQFTIYEYFANDLRKKVTYHNDSFTEYAYDEVNRLNVITHRKSDGSVIQSYDYGYDNMNNRVSVTYGGTTVSYGYDKTYKLTSATYPGETVSYTYDPVGNRISMSDSSGIFDFDHYDAANRLQYYILPDTSRIDFTYDNNGNIQTRTNLGATTNYYYDEKNQLTEISGLFGYGWEFSYDPTGRRVSEGENPGTTWRFIYDGQNMIAEYPGAMTTPYYVYTSSASIDDLVSMHQESNTYHYLRDGLNSVRLILNPDETIHAGYDYYPFGRLKEEVGSSDNRFTFTGRRKVFDSGLMYYRSRYYNPDIGRFLKKDNYMGLLRNPLSLNPYNYVNSNPLKYTDPSGQSEVGFLLIATAFVAANAVIGLEIAFQSARGITHKAGDQEDIDKFEKELTPEFREAECTAISAYLSAKSLTMLPVSGNPSAVGIYSIGAPSEVENLYDISQGDTVTTPELFAQSTFMAISGVASEMNPYALVIPGNTFPTDAPLKTRADRHLSSQPYDPASVCYWKE